MTVYNINLGICWASSGVEYAKPIAQLLLTIWELMLSSFSWTLFLKTIFVI